MKEKELHHLLESRCTYKLNGSFPHQYKTFYRNKENEALFDLLDQEGFFDFHITNDGSMVNYHQVVAFFFCGGRKRLNNGGVCRKGHHEVHHLDGNTENNSASNLVYVPVQVHLLLTNCQRGVSKLFKRLKRRMEKGDLQNLEIWNKEGKTVKRLFQWLRVVLTKTVLLTCRFLTVEVSIKGLHRYTRGVVKRLKLGLDPSFVRLYHLQLEPLSSIVDHQRGSISADDHS